MTGVYKTVPTYAVTMLEAAGQRVLRMTPRPHDDPDFMASTVAEAAFALRMGYEPLIARCDAEALATAMRATVQVVEVAG